MKKRVHFERRLGLSRKVSGGRALCKLLSLLMCVSSLALVFYIMSFDSISEDRRYLGGMWAAPYSACDLVMVEAEGRANLTQGELCVVRVAAEVHANKVGIQC